MNTAATEFIAMIIVIASIYVVPLAVLAQLQGAAGAVPINYREIIHAADRTASRQ